MAKPLIVDTNKFFIEFMNILEEYISQDDKAIEIIVEEFKNDLKNVVKELALQDKIAPKLIALADSILTRNLFANVKTWMYASNVSEITEEFVKELNELDEIKELAEIAYYIPDYVKPDEKKVEEITKEIEKFPILFQIN